MSKIILSRYFLLTGDGPGSHDVLTLYLENLVYYSSDKDNWEKVAMINLIRPKKKKSKSIFQLFLSLFSVEKI